MDLILQFKMKKKTKSCRILKCQMLIKCFSGGKTKLVNYKLIKLASENIVIERNARGRYEPTFTCGLTR